MAEIAGKQVGQGAPGNASAAGEHVAEYSDRLVVVEQRLDELDRKANEMGERLEEFLGRLETIEFNLGIGEDSYDDGNGNVRDGYGVEEEDVRRGEVHYDDLDAEWRGEDMAEEVPGRRDGLVEEPGEEREENPYDM